MHTDVRYRSQTSWIWLETKLVELGMLGSDRNYKVRDHPRIGLQSLTGFDQISFGEILTRTPGKLNIDRLVSTGQNLYVHGFYRTREHAVYTVINPTDLLHCSTDYFFSSVKALQIIWNHFPQ